jgi:hypothetical protein
MLGCGGCLTGRTNTVAFAFTEPGQAEARRTTRSLAWVQRRTCKQARAAAPCMSVHAATFQQPRCYNAHAVKKNRQYRARGGGIGPPAGAVSAAALKFFWGARAFALSGAPNVRRRLPRAPSLRTRANVQRAEIPPLSLPPRALHSPPPPAPPPQYFAADRFRRRAFWSPPPRHRSASPAPPPEALAPRRRPAPSLPTVASRRRPRRRRCFSPALSVPPSPWRRAYCQHGAAKTLAGLLTRYAPPPAAIIFIQFSPTS